VKVPLLAPLASDRGLDVEHHMVTVSGVTTCHVGAVQGSASIQDVQTELDSHADTCVVGSETALITQDFGRQVKVSGFDGTKSANAKTVTGVLGYVDPGTGDRFMLVVHQAILVPKMTANLLGVMQLRDNGILINDEPKHMALNPSDDHHCITISGSQDRDQLRIPLLIKGVTSYFPTWKPTMEEFEGTPLDRIIKLTNKNVDWDPQQETRFEEQEGGMLGPGASLKDPGAMDATHRMVAAIHSSREHELPESMLELSLAGNVSSMSTKREVVWCQGRGSY